MNKIIVRFKKLHDSAVAPFHGSETAAGYDLTAVAITHDDVAGVTVVDFGLAVSIPCGYAGFMFLRSSAYKTPYAMTNCVGVIDSDYRGPIKAHLRCVSPQVAPPRYMVGDRVCQLVILPTPLVEYSCVEELDATTRGTNGYGSTGR